MRPSLTGATGRRWRRTLISGAMRVHVDFGRAARALAASAVLLVVVTAAIELLKPHVPVLSLGALYLFVVLPIAVFWGPAYAVAVSVACMLALNWFFLEP